MGSKPYLVVRGFDPRANRAQLLKLCHANLKRQSHRPSQQLLWILFASSRPQSPELYVRHQMRMLASPDLTGRARRAPGMTNSIRRPITDTSRLMRPCASRKFEASASGLIPNLLPPNSSHLSRNKFHKREIAIHSKQSTQPISTRYKNQLSHTAVRPESPLPNATQPRHLRPSTRPAHRLTAIPRNSSASSPRVGLSHLDSNSCAKIAHNSFRIPVLQKWGGGVETVPTLQKARSAHLFT